MRDEQKPKGARNTLEQLPSSKKRALRTAELSSPFAQNVVNKGDAPPTETAPLLDEPLPSTIDIPVAKSASLKQEPSQPLPSTIDMPVHPGTSTDNLHDSGHHTTQVSMSAATTNYVVKKQTEPEFNKSLEPPTPLKNSGQTDPLPPNVANSAGKAPTTKPNSQNWAEQPINVAKPSSTDKLAYKIVDEIVDGIAEKTAATEAVNIEQLKVQQAKQAKLAKQANAPKNQAKAPVLVQGAPAIVSAAVGLGAPAEIIAAIKPSSPEAKVVEEPVKYNTAESVAAPTPIKAPNVVSAAATANPNADVPLFSNLTYIDSQEPPPSKFKTLLLFAIPLVLLFGAALAISLYVPALRDKLSEKLPVSISGILGLKPKDTTQVSIQEYRASIDEKEHTATITGVVTNLSENPVGPIQLEFQLAKRNDARVTETRLVNVEPVQLTPNQQGKYQFTFSAKDYEESKLLRALNNNVFIKVKKLGVVDSPALVEATKEAAGEENKPKPTVKPKEDNGVYDSPVEYKK